MTIVLDESADNIADISTMVRHWYRQRRCHRIAYIDGAVDLVRELKAPGEAPMLVICGGASLAEFWRNCSATPRVLARDAAGCSGSGCWVRRISPIAIASFTATTWRLCRPGLQRPDR